MFVQNPVETVNKTMTLTGLKSNKRQLKVTGAMYFAGLLIAVVLASPVFAGLSLSPENVELTDVSRSEKVYLSNDGKPVLPAEITKIVTGVFKSGNDLPSSASGETHFSDYSYMFKFEAGKDGSITITANKDAVQIGKYDLHVRTVFGTVTGTINATLSQSSPIGKSQREELPEFTYNIVLPDYSLGQQVSVNLPSDTVNTYSWYIDGKLHSSGVGETSFRARPDAGTHEISFIARNPEGEMVSKWSDTIKVVK